MKYLLGRVCDITLHPALTLVFHHSVKLMKISRWVADILKIKTEEVQLPSLITLHLKNLLVHWKLPYKLHCLLGSFLSWSRGYFIIKQTAYCSHLASVTLGFAAMLSYKSHEKRNNGYSVKWRTRIMWPLLLSQLSSM